MADTQQFDEVGALLDQFKRTEEPHLDGTPEVTWDDIKVKRFADLLQADREYNFDSPEEMIADYQAYKQTLRDIISNAKAEGKEPWEVARDWPDSPSEKWQPKMAVNGIIPQ